MPFTTDALPIETATGKPALVHVETAADAASWAHENRDAVRAAVADRGALLVRGLDLREHAGAAAAMRAVGGDPMAEREAFAPRQSLGGGLYSATPWPANQPMCMHHELSYTLAFPGLIMFACLSAPASGGATTVADGAAVLSALPSDLVTRFEREGWILTRSYNEDIGASWQVAFGTEDRAAVEAYCRDNAIAFTWQADGGLRTRQHRSAVLTHPVTGVRSWFNQVAFLSEWTMAEEVREYLVDEYGPDGLPFNTRFGNGEPIGADVVERIAEVYDAHTVREPWQGGDLLVVDNLRTAHAREAYTGDREVVVAMACPTQVSTCAPTAPTSNR